MPVPNTAPSPVQLMCILTRSEVRQRLASIWIWIVASAICLMAAIYGGGFRSAFETETILVSSDPLSVINCFVLCVLAIVLGLRLAASLAWEREHRTLEVLLVSPVGYTGVVISKFLAELVVLGVLLVLYCLYLLLAQPLGASVLLLSDTAGLWMIAVFTLPVLAFGVFMASFVSSVRAAVVAFLVSAFLLLGLEALTQALRFQSPQNLSLSLLYLRSILESLQVVLAHISPSSYLADVTLASVGAAVLTVPRAAGAAVLSVGLLAASIVVNMRKGPQ